MADRKRSSSKGNRVRLTRPTTVVVDGRTWKLAAGSHTVPDEVAAVLASSNALAETTDESSPQEDD